MTDPLAGLIAGDLTDYVPTASPLSDEQLRAVAAALRAHPDAVLAALGYERWGGWVEDDEKGRGCNHDSRSYCSKAHHQRVFTLWRHRGRPDVQTRDRST